MKKVLVNLLLAACSMSMFADHHNGEMKASPSAPNSAAYIISPKDGDTVSKTFTVRFGLKGMGVAPAGVKRKHTGHHHLLVDFAQLPPLDKPLGGDVKHFGSGQTEVSVTLEPGTHTLQLILGDHLHRPHSPAVVSEKITITVE
ncbi:MAG: DUF4399 domain-containing protein [Kangiellaceae bacterium]|jgi:hypothetical protein|nr:DUF4399 domain-containing protein [Kangiellaceae bacterium]